MNSADALQQLRELAPTVRALGVVSLYLFGSAARGEATPDSDLDLFVDIEPGRTFSLFDLVGLKQLLEDRLRVEVDVTTRGGLNPHLRSDIETSALRVF
jgi:predicted nucleotidyltransferase